MIFRMRKNLAPMLRNALLAGSALLLASCTYDMVRMNEQRSCAGMPQAEATRCRARTADTKAEYEAKRKQLRESLDGAASQPPADPRYEQWLPDL